MAKQRSGQRAHKQTDVTASLQSLLVPVDLLPASDRVLGRLARLPVADEALVTLLHVVPAGLAPRDQRNAERDAKRLLTEEARQVAQALPKAARVQTVVKVGNVAREITELASAQAADLIVMGRGEGRALRDTFLGSTAERVMRTAKRPVLAVRLSPRTDYRRPAMAIELDESAPRVLSSLLQVLPQPCPLIEVIHAFQSPYESVVYPSLPEDDAEERRGELRQAASAQLGRLMTTTLAQQPGPTRDTPWKMHVRYGAARLVVARAVKQGNADLLALGTHGYSGLSLVFLGSVAGDLLREVSCDVLLVPPSERSSAR